MDWRSAEELACDYLRRRGYRILERNYRTAFGEVDIIAKKRGTFVFVEVKSGRSSRIRPSERVDLEKYRRVAQVAEFYLKERKFKSARIDVIEVSEGRIEHYENVGWEFV